MREIERDIVSALIFSKDGKLFQGMKNAKKGGVYSDCWHLPGGGVNDGENKEEALKREVKEETGLKILDIKPTSYFCEYEWPKGSGKMHHEDAFLVIVKEAGPQLSGEHLEYKWLEKEDFLKQIAWQGNKEELEGII